MQAVNSDSWIPLGERSLEEFAQNMAAGIIQSFQNQLEKLEPGQPGPDEGRGVLAEALASAVIETALREVSGVHAWGSDSSVLALKSHRQKAEKLYFVDKSGEDEGGDLLDSVQEIQTGAEVQGYHPPLSQSGLTIAGSLDYPDAPPTTPLLPELERSRHSFARKLKGGLAKVFLPSPPPPTPKDREDHSDGTTADPHLELMELLVHSLTTDDLAGDGSDVASQPRAGMEAFAEALSWDILDWALTVKTRDTIADQSDVHRLAQQLAETIISSSLDKAKMLD
ncbi:unnamed protein product [Menidia menidia]|uniref:(Atlantic silverside) hypothetical protein n=1 Tax=Menidia menidia TaxID=238744 RepID=A0A8S4B554_9TELE|nr:unnamed protein product [Menidia menidia]